MPSGGLTWRGRQITPIEDALNKAAHNSPPVMNLNSSGSQGDYPRCSWLTQPERLRGCGVKPASLGGPIPKMLPPCKLPNIGRLVL
jgi:hypothetical protein